MNVKGPQPPGKPLRLYVNVDHVATVREARRAAEPDPLEAAAAAERGGADGITVHLREDRRHIRDRDVLSLQAQVTTVLNLELSTAPEILALAEDLRPHQATFVPERREEITTEGGLVLAGDTGRLREAIARLTAAGVRISLFIDPEPEALDRAAELAVPAVELHTGRYANAWPEAGWALQQLADAARHGRNLGLDIHAGHGLNYDNVRPVAALADIEELNIGHSVVSRAILTGMESAVRRMRDELDAAR